jgi:phosphoglycerol transferase
MSIVQQVCTALSLLFFVIGIRRFVAKGPFNRWCLISIFGYGFLYLLYSVFYIACHYFTGQGIDHSVLYHVKYGLEGAGFGEYRGLIVFSIGSIVVFSLLGLFLLLKVAKKRTQSGSHSVLLLFLLFSLAGIAHPATVDLLSLAQGNADIAFLKYYRTPYLQATKKKPKNFVVIYAESLERTFFDEQIFPGLITHLKKKEAEGIAFTNLGGYPETGWTIAGLVASQCGLPLVSPSHGNSMGGMDSFLAGAVCMGDLLKQAGYHLVFMGGASLQFAGKGKFHTTHGFAEVLGRKELSPLLADASYNSGWGLHDDSLFDLAVKKFAELSRNPEQPFGLFLLTLDTHGSDQLSRSCQHISYGDFIDRLRQSPLFKDTIIVVASDHLAMRNSASALLEQSEKRKNLFFILDPAQPGFSVEKNGSTLDIGSTLLSVLGYENYLGLGRNLLTESSILDSTENVKAALKGWRKDIMKFWVFPKVRQAIAINARDFSIEIDGRSFSASLLLAYNRQLETKLWFGRNSDPGHKQLTEHLAELDPDSPFLLLIACNRLPAEWQEGHKQGRCMVSGKLGSAKMQTVNLVSNVRLTADQLRELAAYPVDKQLHASRVHQLLSLQKTKQ